MAKDPVCGMECDPRTSDKVEYQGETYYFCAPGCKAEFQKNPDKYVRAGHEGHEGHEHHGMHHEGHHH